MKGYARPPPFDDEKYVAQLGFSSESERKDTESLEEESLLMSQFSSSRGSADLSK